MLGRVVVRCERRAGRSVPAARRSGELTGSQDSRLGLAERGLVASALLAPRPPSVDRTELTELRC